MFHRACTSEPLQTTHSGVHLPFSKIRPNCYRSSQQPDSVITKKILLLIRKVTTIPSMSAGLRPENCKMCTLKSEEAGKLLSLLKKTNRCKSASQPISASCPWTIWLIHRSGPWEIIFSRSSSMSTWVVRGHLILKLVYPGSLLETVVL